MPRRIYVGPIVEMVTRLDDVEMVVARGQSVDVSDEQAAQLDLQPDNWAKPRVPSSQSPRSPKEGDS